MGNGYQGKGNGSKVPPTPPKAQPLDWGYARKIKDLEYEKKKIEQERDKYMFQLWGAMHFVDKWLTEKEIANNDETNRAFIMRHRTRDLVEKLERENAKLKSKLQKLQNAFDKGKTVSFSYDSDGYVVIDYGDIEEWKEYAERDKVDRVFYGKVVIEE